MMCFALRNLLVVSLSTYAFASEPITSTEESGIPEVTFAPTEIPNKSSNTGTVEELAKRLADLTLPIEQKLKDCNGEVAKANELLVDLESQLVKTIQTIRQTHKELIILKDALGNQGCEISIGGHPFRRELITEGLEKRLAHYQSRITELKQLRSGVATQKIILQEAISKLERWQAKEKELLQKVVLLQTNHEDLLRERNAEELTQITSLQAELKEMLDNVDSVSQDVKVPTTEVKEETDSATPPSQNAVGVARETKTFSEEADDSIKKEASAKNAKSVTKVDRKLATEVEVEVEIDVDSIPEVDAVINPDEVEPIVEKP